MTTCQQIRDAWNSAVFSHASILAITTAIYDFELPFEGAGMELGRFYNEANNQIDSFSYVVTSGQRPRASVHFQDYIFEVRIRHYRENDPSGANFKSIADRFQLIDSLVRTNLGHKWSNTVDLYEAQTEPLLITQAVIDDRQAWIGEYVYTGVKITQV